MNFFFKSKSVFLPVEPSHSSTLDSVKDVIIVGAGPAGLSAALSAVQKKLSYIVLDQQDAGATVARLVARIASAASASLLRWPREPSSAVPSQPGTC